jgi:hypothetical protein
MSRYIYSYYYHITTLNCTYQKSSASESASSTCALSHSRLSCFSASHFDLQRHFFEGPDSSSINSTSCVANSISPALLDIVKLRLWCPFSFFLIDMNGIIIIVSFHVCIISTSVHFRINFIHHPLLFHAFVRITLIVHLLCLMCKQKIVA